MISCRLLGSPDLADETGRRLDTVLNQPKRFGLLAYLAVEANGTPVPRDKIAALFWPELDQERARHALRQSLHVLRREVGDDALSAIGNELAAVEPKGFRCDVAQFEGCLRDARWEEALALYRGDLLDGFHVSDAPEVEEWAERKRSELRARAMDAAMRAARGAAERKDADQAAGLLRRALALAPTNETALRDLMALLRDTGHRAEAVAEYEQFSARLRADYELEPSPETNALAASLRAAPRASAVGAVVSRVSDAARRWSAETAVPLRRVAQSSIAAAAALGLVLVITAGWYAFTRRPATPLSRAADATSVAVLPFVDLSPARDQEYFSDGLTEELITALSKIPSLRVPARTSSFAFKNVQRDVGRIARELGVSNVLEGSVRKSGQRLRITAQLIDARSGYHLWSETYNRDLADVFAVQEEIARAIAGALKLELIGRNRPTGRLVTRATGSAAAYDSYLKGLYFWNQRNSEGVAKAIAYFQAAIDQDPRYAMAYAGLAHAYQIAPSFDVLPPGEVFPKALGAVNRAMQLDPALPEAHASLGYIKMHWERDWSGAESELRRAIALNPAYATAHQWLRLYYVAVGRLAEAVEAAKQAQRLDPLSISIHAALGDTYVLTRDYRSAITAFNAALELDPRYGRARSGLGSAYLFLGRTREAVAEHERAVRESPRSSRYAAELGFTYARVGRRDEANRILEFLRQEHRRRYVPALSFALLHAGLGQRDSAFHWLDRTMEEHDNWAMFIPALQEFDELRADARFTAVLSRLRLPQRGI